jgi:hypothetical protein
MKIDPKHLTHSFLAALFFEIAILATLAINRTALSHSFVWSSFLYDLPSYPFFILHFAILMGLFYYQTSSTKQLKNVTVLGLCLGIVTTTVTAIAISHVPPFLILILAFTQSIPYSFVLTLLLLSLVMLPFSMKNISAAGFSRQKIVYATIFFIIMGWYVASFFGRGLL